MTQQRWPTGFCCPCCGYDGNYVIKARGYWACSQYRKQTSLTAGALFHLTCC
ncbi:transposase [Nitrosomonas sp.]|uniref:transposase n=1 Tax=Nitrosomonas sp. TaxID=42353 RepID=UPI0035CCDFC7